MRWVTIVLGTLVAVVVVVVPIGLVIKSWYEHHPCVESIESTCTYMRCMYFNTKGMCMHWTHDSYPCTKCVRREYRP